MAYLDTIINVLNKHVQMTFCKFNARILCPSQIKSSKTTYYHELSELCQT